MMQAGLKDVTGLQTEGAAWDALFRRINTGGYQAGQKVAIKVNFNCAEYGNGTCENHDTDYIDALAPVVLSVVESLHRVGVAYTDITIYDATTGGKKIYAAFRNAFSGKAVHFLGKRLQWH